MSYFKTIDGKKLSASLLEKATQMTEGAGDGRISLKDAEVLFEMIREDNILTNTERDTIDYIQKHFRWTPSAEEWFNREMKHWQRHKPPIPITLEELTGKHFPKDEVLTDPVTRAERDRLLKAATKETNEDHDEIGLWIRVSDGTTVEVLSNFIELAGDFVQLRGGCLVPVRAIEKVEI